MGHEPSRTQLGCVAKTATVTWHPETCFAIHNHCYERTFIFFITFWTMRCSIIYSWILSIFLRVQSAWWSQRKTKSHQPLNAETWIAGYRLDEELSLEWIGLYPQTLHPYGFIDVCLCVVFFPPECLFIFPCQWNYRPDHCMYGSNCKGAEEEGVSILHGNRGVYHDDKQPAFKVVYDAIRDVSISIGCSSFSEYTYRI